MRRYDAVLGLLLLGVVWASIAVCCTGCEADRIHACGYNCEHSGVSMLRYDSSKDLCECMTAEKDGGR